MVKNAVQSIFPDPLRPQAEIIEENQPRKWIEIKISEDWPWSTKQTALRLNGFGSLFYFSKYILNHTLLSPNLHGYICSQLEAENLKLVMEIPRSHLKTTCATISGSMWWALPFLEEDEQAMRELGYGDEWIKWMKAVHSAHTRTLLCSEVGKNIKDLGEAIDLHYQKNEVFRLVYSEIIPKNFNRDWNDSTKRHVRCGDADGGFHGEGTYDLIGAGSAMQMRHYIRIIEDDLFGERAKSSETEAEALFGWHQKIPGLYQPFEGQPDKTGDQLVIGNRWSKKDLNQRIRDNDSLKQWIFLTHDAEGGCCELHPEHGKPIFPEVYSMAKLAKIRADEGSYNYACQFRNNPVDAEAVRFKMDWLRRFSESEWQGKEDERVSPLTIANYQQLDCSTRRMTLGELDAHLEKRNESQPLRMKKAIRHEVAEGEIIDDIRVGELDRVAIVDPRHEGEDGRRRNAIIVLGFYLPVDQPHRIYLLDCWADDCLHDRWIEAAVGTRQDSAAEVGERGETRGLCLLWKVQSLYGEFGTNTSKGWQKVFHMRRDDLYRNREHCFSVRPLKADRSLNGMHNRIIGMESVYESTQFWVPRRGHGVDLFLEEFREYPNGKFVDLLSTIGYAPQSWPQGSRHQTKQAVSKENTRRKAVVVNIGQAGY